MKKWLKCTSAIHRLPAFVMSALSIMALDGCTSTPLGFDCQSMTFATINLPLSLRWHAPNWKFRQGWLQTDSLVVGQRSVSMCAPINPFFTSSYKLGRRDEGVVDVRQQEYQ